MPFALPAALTEPLKMLMPSQPDPELIALIKPYQFHWSAGAVFTVCIVAISLACAYVFLLFQIGNMLRDKAGGPARPDLTGAARSAKQQKRSSWSSRGSGRIRPTTKVIQALKMKKISGPSPIPEEWEDDDAKKSPMTSESGAGPSTAGSSNHHGERRGLPRLSFAPLAQESPRRMRDFV